MRQGVATIACICCLAAPGLVCAQETAAAPETLKAPRSSSFWAPFAEVPSDLGNFLSTDTLRVLAPAAVSAIALNRWDDDGVKMSSSRLRPVSSFKAGNIGGGLLAQTGGAFAVYVIGRATKSATMAALGSDLVRAQILTQATVQATKFVTRRVRPDASDRYSLPSGHVAGTFATATILQKHYGWRVGVPAYAAGAYVAASRMSANKHHLSDVIMGAAMGIATGGTISVGSSAHRFDIGLSATTSGGAITFTKQ
jgi:membrane-associated phospholipid phosphatase